MMELVLPNGTKIPYFKEKAPSVVTEVRTIEHVVQDRVTRIDHDTDNSHVYLEGNLGENDNFVRCKNPYISNTEDVFKVNYQGSVFCNDIFSSTTDNILEIINEISQETVALNDIVLDNTHEAIPNTLVARSNSGASFINQIQGNFLHLKDRGTQDAVHLNLQGGSMFFIPVEGNQNGERSDAIYRFGENHEEMDFTGHGDGLEFTENNNHIMIQTNEHTPVIDITSYKTGNEATIQVRQISSGSSDSEVTFALHQDGVHTVGLNIGTGPQFDKCTVDENGDIGCRDIICRDITCTDKVEAEDIEIHNTSTNPGTLAFRILNHEDTRVFSVSNDGQIRSKFQEQNDILNAFEDNSVFIGSARYGYKRTTHEATVKVLKQNHIPKYLADLGLTTGNLSNYTTFGIDNLTVKRWVKVAENFTGDDHYPNLVFPGANENDDFENAIHKHAQAAITALETDVTALQNAGSGLGTDAEVENLNGSASLKVSATTATNQHNASIEIVVDSTTNDLLDHRYRLVTNEANSMEWAFQSWQTNNTWLTAFRVAPTGQLIFGNATSYGLADFRVKGTSYFDTTCTMNGNLLLQGTNVKDKLDDIPSPVLVRSTAHENPGSPALYDILPDNITVFVHDQNQTSRRRMPLNKVDGKTFIIMAAADTGLGNMELHSGFLSSKFHPNSVGYWIADVYSVSGIGARKLTATYIAATDLWLIL